MRSISTCWALLLAFVPILQAEDPVARLGELSPGPRENFLSAVLENLTDEPIWTSSPRGIVLQHKIDGEWTDTPRMTLSGHAGTEQYTRIESGGSLKVGVHKELNPSLAQEPYRLKVVLIEPETGKAAGFVLSKPLVLRSGSD